MRLLEIKPGVLLVPDLVTHVRGVSYGPYAGYSVFVTFIGGGETIASERSWDDPPSPGHVDATAAAAARDVADLIDRHRSGDAITVVRV